MCNFCVAHGMGTKWYLNPKNLDLKKAYDIPEVRAVWEEVAVGPKGLVDLTAVANALPDELPYSKETLDFMNEQVAKTSGGQIAPLEDALKILKIVDKHDMKIGLTICACRKLWGGKNKFSCMHFEPFCDMVTKVYGTLSKHDRYITTDEAIEICKESNKEGLVHWIEWTAMPWVTAICNCELPYCLAIRTRILSGIRNAAMKSHHIAQIDQSRCDGCGGSPQCLLACNFGAIRFSRLEQFAAIDPTVCFGCGLCREKCENKAIRLIDRESVAVAKDLW